MNGFRLLRADEIDCRIGSIKKNGLSLLLYKDARCDMNILDETVGMFNWKREHSRDNANCTVYIYDEKKNEWVWKEDTGTESNTEAQKGLASDSFKRACFNWGIGRELYTAPFIWIPSDKCEIEQINGRYICYDKFAVKTIAYNEQSVITKLEISNEKTGAVVYSFGGGSNTKKAAKASTSGSETKSSKDTGDQYVKEQNGISYAICEQCGDYIYDMKKKNGEVMPVREYVAKCLQSYGKPLCKKCLPK